MGSKNTIIVVLVIFIYSFTSLSHNKKKHNVDPKINKTASSKEKTTGRNETEEIKR